MRWLNRGKSKAALDLEDEQWVLHDPDLSWKVWVLLENMEWRHLPYPGGLLEQPDWLFDDLFTIAWRRRWVDEHAVSGIAAQPGTKIMGA